MHGENKNFFISAVYETYRRKGFFKSFAEEKNLSHITCSGLAFPVWPSFLYDLLTWRGWILSIAGLRDA